MVRWLAKEGARVTGHELQLAAFGGYHRSPTCSLPRSCVSKQNVGRRTQLKLEEKGSLLCLCFGHKLT